MNTVHKSLQNFETEFSSKSSSVRLKGITKSFPNRDGGEPIIAVNNIDLEINDGELTTLLGPSGCGKTTTLRMISGFEVPTSGGIYIGSENVVSVPPNKRDIAMVFQSYALFPHLTIYENIAYGLKLKRLSKAAIQERGDKVLKMMKLEEMKNRYPSQISGGQQQRVALARAVVIEPRVLLFDEPLSNLDAKLREYMRDELRNQQRSLGITSIYVTHDQLEAMAISDSIVIMDHGLIAQKGTPAEIYEYPNSKFVANFIGKSNFIPGKAIEKKSTGIMVQVRDQVIEVPKPGAFTFEQNMEVTVSIRPESIHLTREKGLFSGTVIKAVYFGSKMEYEVHMPDDLLLMIEEYNPQLTGMFHEGDQVNIQLDLNSIRLLES